MKALLDIGNNLNDIIPADMKDDTDAVTDAEFDKLLKEIDNENDSDSDSDSDGEIENKMDGDKVEPDWSSNILWKAFYEIGEYYAQARNMMISDLIAVLQSKSKLQYKLPENHGISQTIFEDIMLEMIGNSTNDKYIAYTTVDSDQFTQFWSQRKFKPKHLSKYITCTRTKETTEIATEDGSKKNEQDKESKQDDDKPENEKEKETKTKTKTGKETGERDKLIDAFYKIQRVWLQIGITLSWWSKMPYNTSKDVSENDTFRQFYKKYKDYIDVNYQSGGKVTRNSLYFVCVYLFEVTIMEYRWFTNV